MSIVNFLAWGSTVARTVYIQVPMGTHRAGSTLQFLCHESASTHSQLPSLYGDNVRFSCTCTSRVGWLILVCTFTQEVELMLSLSIRTFTAHFFHPSACFKTLAPKAFQLGLLLRIPDLILLFHISALRFPFLAFGTTLNFLMPLYEDEGFLPSTQSAVLLEIFYKNCLLSVFTSFPQ